MESRIPHHGAEGEDGPPEWAALKSVIDLMSEMEYVT